MIETIGAGFFGAIIGWLIYYINRYCKEGAQFSDLTTVVGIIGGAGWRIGPGPRAEQFTR
jgi:hypothetical protein